MLVATCMLYWIETVLIIMHLFICNHSEIYSYPYTTAAVERNIAYVTLERNVAYETVLSSENGSENENTSTYETVQ